MLPIALRMSLAIAVVLLVAVLMTAALNVLKFQQIIQAQEENRYAFVTRDVAHVFEQSLNLGLPIDQIENAEETLERQLAVDTSISGIAVFDPAGRVLYQASHLAPGWVTAALDSDRTTRGTKLERFTSRPIFNAFGQLVGGVVVRHTDDARVRRNQTILEVMSLTVLGAAAIGVVIVWFGSSRLLAPFRTRLLAMVALLRQAARGDLPAVEADQDFEVRTQATLRDLRLTEQEIDDMISSGTGSQTGQTP